MEVMRGEAVRPVRTWTCPDVCSSQLSGSENDRAVDNFLKTIVRPLGI